VTENFAQIFLQPEALVEIVELDVAKETQGPLPNEVSVFVNFIL
jgi:hypothetical protein